MGYKLYIYLITTTIIILCPELLLSGLYQVIYNLIILFCVHNIFSAPGISGGDGVELDISRSLIADAIKRLHPSSINHIFINSDDSYPKMLSLQSISVDKTQFWQFGAIFEDEGIIDKTYTIHESIFLKQLGLQAPDNLNSIPDDFCD